MKSTFAVALLLALWAPVAIAQRPGGQPSARLGQGFQQRGNNPGAGGGSRPGSPGSSALERAGVKLGQALPDLTIFDDEGAKFRLADIKGRHTVIVFGCLT